jgi:polyisoprenyl-teichoic acid--peptidoglycan teichoic acid transferase
LSMRVKDGNVRSIVFKSGINGFHSSNPDFSLMRKRVKAAIGEAKHPKAKKKSGATIQSESVNNACAYDPKVAETARPYR